MSSTNEAKPPLGGAIWELGEKSPLAGEFVVIVGKSPFYQEVGGLCVALTHLDSQGEEGQKLDCFDMDMPDEIGLWLPNSESMPHSINLAVFGHVPEDEFSKKVGAVRLKMFDLACEQVYRQEPPFKRVKVTRVNGERVIEDDPLDPEAEAELLSREPIPLTEQFARDMYACNRLKEHIHSRINGEPETDFTYDWFRPLGIGEPIPVKE